MSKLLVVDEHHYYRDKDGNVWIPSQNDYTFWLRYLQVFDSILVVSRIADLLAAPTDMLLSSGPNVQFANIPNYTGPYQYARNMLKVKRALRGIHEDCTHAIFRLPSELSFNIYKDYVVSDKPYGVELLIDPWDGLAPGVTKSFVRPYVRRRHYKLTKKICMNANGVAYVTQRVLQKRYPCKAILTGSNDRYFTTHYSSIHLDKEFLSKKTIDDNKVVKILHVGTMQNHIKGQDVLLKAAQIVINRGYSLELIFVGDGIYKREYEMLAENLGISKYVRFTGYLSGSNEVRNYYLESDILVYPTKAEGLPRVVIEAMACSLPVISSPVNGVPELISDDLLVESNDYVGFSHKIIELIDCKDRRFEISKLNYLKSQEYTTDILQQRRKIFYEKLKNLSKH